MVEFEGEVVSLSNPQDQIKHLRRVVNNKDAEIKALKSQLEETNLLLEVANERVKRLLGSLTWKTREKEKTARAKRALRQKRKVETQLSPISRLSEPEMGTTGSESIST
jgi:regulator of replication initiation timing